MNYLLRQTLTESDIDFLNTILVNSELSTATDLRLKHNWDTIAVGVI